MDLSHEPITVEDWKGMYTRGVTDSTPRGFFQDSLNVKFSENDVYTRDGSTKVLTASGIIRFFMYKRLGETPRIIWLDTTGNLYDSLFPSTPIWVDASFVDFSLINFNNRAYITPHNRTIGIPGKYVLVYDGNGTARLAAGAAPTGFTLLATDSASSGNCEAGIHLIGVCYESSSGFISAPGPTAYAQVASTGGRRIDLANVPALPTGMVAVRVVATKAIQIYNGNQLGYQFYLVPSGNGGRITGGASTGSLSFFDTELQVTADYLFDNRQLIPAGVGIGEYQGRMMIWGINGDEHSIYLSKPFDPEQFDTLGGYIIVNPFDNASGVKNCCDFRGNLLICKSNRSYITQDNNADPNTWKPLPVDQGGGTECFGIATILDSKGQQTDKTFIADRSGLLLYEGYFKRPEGSWLVEDTWKRITKSAFSLIQVCVDTTNSAIYVTVPLDGSTSISHVIYGYYGGAYGRYGFDVKTIKWSLWQFQPGTKSICVDVNASKDTVLKYSGSAGNIYDMLSDYSVHADDGNAFQSYVQMALFSVKAKWINHLALVNLRVQGSGFLLNTVSGQDDSNTTTLQTLTLSATPGMDREIKANFQNERIAPKFRTGVNINEYFKISRAELYIKPLWMSRSA